jgi:hypothetical protein
MLLFRSADPSAIGTLIGSLIGSFAVHTSSHKYGLHPVAAAGSTGEGRPIRIDLCCIVAAIELATFLSFQEANLTSMAHL